MKVEFVASNFNHITSLKNDEIQALTQRVISLEQKINAAPAALPQQTASTALSNKPKPSKFKNKLGRSRTTTSKAKFIRVCAFNIANFGATKFKKDHVLEIIVKILYRYDLTVVQEIRSEEFDVVEKTLHELNNYSKFETIETYIFFTKCGTNLFQTHCTAKKLDLRNGSKLNARVSSGMSTGKSSMDTFTTLKS